TAPDRSITSMAYDAGHRLVKWHNPEGDRTTFGYDGSGRVQKIVLPGGERVSYSYATNQTVRTDPRGNRTTMIFYGTDNNFNSVPDPVGGITTYTWDTGQLASMTDGRGNRTTFAYVKLTNNNVRVLQSATTPLGNRFTYSWDTSAGRLRALVDALGRR